MKVELDIKEMTTQAMPGEGAMPCWAQDNPSAQIVFRAAKGEFPHLDDETIWDQILKEITAMSGNDNSQYLGNDSEVVNIPADQGSDPNAGWGSDDAVVQVPTENQ